MAEITFKYSDGETAVFQAHEGQNLLAAAENANVAVAFNCKGGICRACSAYEPSSDTKLLLCQTVAGADQSTFHLDYTASAIAIKAAKRKAKLVDFQKVSDTVYRLRYRLQFPIKFMPGQYARIDLAALDGQGPKVSRYFSMANAPSIDNQLSFYIKDIPDGHMSRYLSSKAAVGDVITIEVPFGTFYLREGNGLPVFIAGGTGLSPMLSMLAHLAETAPDTKAFLIFGISNATDAFALEEIAALKAQLPNLKTQVAAMHNAETIRGAITGSVIDGAKIILEDAAPTAAYLCGPPPMIDAVTAYLQEQQPSITDIYQEVFAPSDIDE